MGLNLQAGQEAMRTGIKGIMAAPRGGATEPTQSVQCVRPVMETGKVEGTSDVTIIDGETCKLGHEGVRKKLKEVTETQDLEIMTETQDLEIMTETQKSKEGGELYETKREIDEHRHIELVRDNGVELGECVVTWCEQQDGLLQEQRKEIHSLEADRDEVSPVGPKEVERMSAVNGYTRSWEGGYGNPEIACGSTNPRYECPGVCG